MKKKEKCFMCDKPATESIYCDEHYVEMLAAKDEQAYSADNPDLD